MKFDSNTLKNWFLNSRRDLPWRNNPTPYAVWVSEVMLQQTRVSVVIPYFERWMRQYPTVASLAEAPLDEVIKMWEGLGYYSRARNLHEGAKTIVTQHDGTVPNTKKELQKIKGLGPYTIGAILSFAFHQKEAAVDGNVIRVLARHFMIDKDIAMPATVKEIREIAATILPDEEPWIVSEALIELGATHCSRKPNCSECPLKRTCLGHRHALADTLPIKSKKVKTIHLTRVVTVITHDNHFLIRRGQQGEIMHDLHEFPYFEVGPEQLDSLDLNRKITDTWGFKGRIKDTLATTTQTFTKYRVKLHPYHFVSKTKKPIPGYHWVTEEELHKLALSSGHKRIFHDNSFLEYGDLSPF